MLTYSGQTINFHQSDSSRSGLASNNRSVAPNWQRRQDGGFAIVGRRKPGRLDLNLPGFLPIVIGRDRIARPIVYFQSWIREGARDSKRSQRSPIARTMIVPSALPPR